MKKTLLEKVQTHVERGSRTITITMEEWNAAPPHERDTIEDLLAVNGIKAFFRNPL
ncbi:MAG TPA: hypothetical protein VKK79_07610 [Candidatus Lokiarchaeia archaeon]|nr:hypothetical protein [Candidatus Lokiarchaeia archaeon]